MSYYVPLADGIGLSDLRRLRRTMERTITVQTLALDAATRRLAEIDKAILECRARREGKDV